jgi:hypothetical protein
MLPARDFWIFIGFAFIPQGWFTVLKLPTVLLLDLD